MSKTTKNHSPPSKSSHCSYSCCRFGHEILACNQNGTKEMLPLLDRPCIDYIVAEAANAGIEKNRIHYCQRKDAMVDYFDRSPALEAHSINTKNLSCWKKFSNVGNASM